MMIRSITAAALLGALLAAGGLYAASRSSWRNMMPAWLAAAPVVRPASEEWPICATMTAMGTEADWAELDPDFAAGKKALDEGWTKYGPTQGLPELRQSIASYISRTRGTKVGPQNICVVPGGKPIIFFPILALRFRAICRDRRSFRARNRAGP